MAHSAVDEMQGVQVKLCYPSTMRAIPEHLRDDSCGGAITFVQPEEAELLRAPPFTGRKMDADLASRCAELNTAISRLSLLSAHDTQICLPHCSVQYKSCTSLCASHPSLEKLG